MSSDKMFKHVGKEQGLRIWKVEIGKIQHWPKELYGEFYCNICYLILRTIQCDEGKFEYSIFLWVGDKVNDIQEQFAFRKMNELHNVLGSPRIYYRETQGNESKTFLRFFPKMCTFLHEFEGVKMNLNKQMKHFTDNPRLFQVTGFKKHVQVDQVSLKVKSLNDNDCFILDAGIKIFQFNGIYSSSWGKRKANAVIDEFVASRRGKVQDTFIIDGVQDTGSNLIDEFWSYFDERPKEIYPCGSFIDPQLPSFEFSLYCMISSTHFEMVQSDKELDKSKLDGDELYVVDCDDYIFIWIGKGADYPTLNPMYIALLYLKGMDNIDILVSGWIRSLQFSKERVVIPVEIVALCLAYLFVKPRDTTMSICVVSQGYEMLEFWNVFRGKSVPRRQMKNYPQQYVKRTRMTSSLKENRFNTVFTW